MPHTSTGVAFFYEAKVYFQYEIGKWRVYKDETFDPFVEETPTSAFPVGSACLTPIAFFLPVFLLDALIFFVIIAGVEGIVWLIIKKRKKTDFPHQ